MMNADPLHQLVEEYRAAEATLNAATEETHEKANSAFNAVLERVMATKEQATTYTGAVAALRMAASDMNGVSSTETVKPLVCGAVAYFDRLEQISGSAGQEACTMAGLLDLSKVTETGWVAILDALESIHLTLEAICCQPRTGTNHTLNAAGEYLSALSDFVFAEQERVIAAATAYRPAPDEDPEFMNKAILRWQADSGCLSFEEIAFLAVKMADQQKTSWARKAGR